MAIGTEFIKKEPLPGFGILPFGGETDKEFGRGFGDAVTKTSADESNKGTSQSADDSNKGTTFTEFTDD